MKGVESSRNRPAGSKCSATLGVEPGYFEYMPFSQHGGLGKVHRLFGDTLNMIIEELNETLAA